ncbi:MAG TPA: lactate racemase domain-containing protein [Pirellulales bacterium]|nr:lactate racemase domain-containing protein [Pirellulales bacterium]
MSPYPQFFRLRQKFERPTVADIPGETQRQLARLKLHEKIKPGQTVALTAGSRGIANIAQIIRTTVEHLKSLGASPFIVPAMGSHGGGTAQGQLQVLHDYGITEEYCGCPLRASMETEIIGQAPEGFPIHVDRYACQADHVVLCGRIKPHTDFTGDIESGLMKMMLLGLGKHAGAKIYHRAFQDFSFGQIVRSVATLVLQRCRIVAGLAVVENAYDETALIEAIPPQDIEQREKQLLVLAKQWMPRLPFQHVDILIIDEMGKDISGAGIDTNVVGRKQYASKAAGDEFPKVRRIMVRNLTPASHGNAVGIGMVEFCTTGLLAQHDQHATWTNILTSGNLPMVKYPLHYDTDREMLDAALPTIGLTEPAQAKMLWIKNTLRLAEVECSAAYLAEARARADLEILTPPRDLPLDAAGNLPPFAPATTDHGSTELAED